MKNIKAFFKRGLLGENAPLVLLVGLTPFLGASKLLSGGVIMGVAAIIVLTLSALFVSLVRKIIPQAIKPVVYMIIIAGFVTAVEILIRTFLPIIFKEIGMYIPLLAVSGFVFAKADSVADKNAVGFSVCDVLASGVGFFCAIVVFSFIRELFGCGTIWGLRIFPEQYGMRYLSMPAGALILLGFMIAVFRLFTAKKDEEGGK